MKNIIFILLCFNIAYGQNKVTIGVRGSGGGTTTTDIDSLDNLLDVVLITPTINQILKFDGTKWVNSSVTGTGTVTSVAATAPSEGFTIAGSPISTSGNFVFSLSNDLLSLENISTTGIGVRTTANAWTTRSIINGTGTTVTNGDGVSGNISINAVDASITNELQTIAWSLITSTTGTATLSNGGGDIIFRAGANTTFANVGGGLEINATGGGGGSGITSLSMAQPLNGFTITPTTLSVPGTFTFTLNSDLLGLENINTTGIAVRTGANSWGTRIVTGSGGITVTNGDGVSGNINISYSGGGSVSGSGTTNYVTKWTSSSTIGVGMIQDNGLGLGIGLAPVANVLTQWGNGDIRVGTGDVQSRLVFGDYFTGTSTARVSIGEEGGTDRLYLKGQSGMMFNISGSTGSVNQLIRANGDGTASWATVSSSDAQQISYSGNSTTISQFISGGNTTNIFAGTNISFSSISASGFTINSTGGGGGTMSMPGSLVYTISGTTGSVDFDAGLGMGINLSGTSTNSVLTFSALDISPSNELNIISTSGLTSTLSNGGGSITMLAGANMTIINVGTSLNPIYSFTSAGGGGGGATDLSWVNSGTNQWLINSSTGTDVNLNFNNGFTTSLSSNIVTVTANDQSNTNELQTIAATSGQITLSNGGGAINLSATGNASISGSGNVITVGSPPYTAGVGISISGNIITNGSLNTDNQNLSLSGQSLSISGGTGVTLPVINIVAGSGIQVIPTSGSFSILNTGDVSTTNELQVFTTSALISTLTGVSSSIGFIAGSNVTITNQGTSQDPRFQIVASSTSYSAGAGINVSGTVITNTGDLSASNEGILQVGAGGSNSSTLFTNTSGSGTINFTAGTGIQILEGTGINGTIEISNTSPGITYTGGSGISVSGSTITNTSPNINQSLSVSANQMTLSNGGGTVNMYSFVSTSGSYTLPNLAVGSIIIVYNSGGGTLTVSSGGSSSFIASVFDNGFGGVSTQTSYGTTFNITGNVTVMFIRSHSLTWQAII